MNNKKTITVCSIIALIILAVVIIITIMSDLAGFGIILGALFIILIVCLGIYLKEEPDEYSAFIKNKKRILRTYDSIIVEVEDIPNIAGKNIIKVKSIEDLVDAQLELREPIYYKNDNDSCFFMLLHYNEACIYILKMNDSVVSPTEQSIRYMKEDKDTKDESENILNNVENTIIYKLDELRSFKISPVRNEEKLEVVDDTAIKQEIEESKEQKITKEALEDEISKTMYINDLKEKIKQFEAEELEKEATLLNIDEETNTKEIEIEKINDKKTSSKDSSLPKSKKTSKKAPAKKKVPKKVTHQERRTIKHKKATK